MVMNNNDQDEHTPSEQIYSSLIVPFSNSPSPAESAYRKANLQKTKGTLFIIPPPESVLRATYSAPPRPQTRMSSGAVALCKHFERIPDSPRSKRDQASGQRHPFWAEPRGSNDDKTRTAEDVLETMLDNACWRNVMLLHRGVAVYEIRNRKGWGMRWTLIVEEITCHDDSQLGSTNNVQEAETDNMTITFKDDRSHVGLQPIVAIDVDNNSKVNDEVGRSTADGVLDDPNLKRWKIKDVTFRGFLEPIEGMDHELLD